MRLYYLISNRLIVVLLLVVANMSQCQFLEQMHVILPDSEKIENVSLREIKIPDFLLNPTPRVLLSTSLDIYQNYISTQDMPACIFTPSCSQFSREAIQICGPIKGVLLTFDRLQRCHTFSDKHKKWYSFDLEKNRFYDPVRFYENK